MDTAADNSSVKCSSDQKPDDDMLERLPVSLSMYGGVRDSMRSEYVAVASRSPSTTSTHSPVNVEQYSGEKDNDNDDIPEIITAEIDEPNKMVAGDMKYRAAITCSWPSIAGQVSVHSPSIGSTQTEGSENITGINKRLSTNCDSGYSELDICSVGKEKRESQIVGEEKVQDFCKDVKCLKPTSFESIFLAKSYSSTSSDYSHIPLASSVKPVLEDLELCFNLEKIVETTDEDKYLQEVENISICSEISSCSDRRILPTQGSKQCHASKLNRAQLNSLQMLTNIQEHNVSKKYAETLLQDKLSLPTANKGKAKLTILSLIENGQTNFDMNGISPLQFVKGFSD